MRHIKPSMVLIAGPWLLFYSALTQAESAPDVLDPNQQQAEAELLADVGKGFSLYRTKHFVLASNVPDALATRIDDRMEQAYQCGLSLCRMLRVEPVVSDMPLEMVLFDHYEEYLHYAAKINFNALGTRGFYNETANRSAFYNAFNDEIVQDYGDKIDQLEASGREPPARLRRLRQELGMQARGALEMAMRHELAHQVQYNLGILKRGVPTPIWLAEGLACMFEVDTSNARRGLVVNRLRLQSYKQAESDNKLIPLQVLITTDRPDTTSNPEEADIFYAQSWALCYYLVKSRPAQVVDYLAAIRARQPDAEISDAQEVEAFTEVFGPLDRLERALNRSMQRMRMDSRR